MPHPAQLEDQILAAFERALAENRPEVAEHLLCALEKLCAEASFGAVLVDAYLALDKKIPGATEKP